MKTFKLHLIRHGLTSGNLQGLYIGSGTDIPLCDEGRAQLAELKERFEYPQVDTVFSSPLMRAVETANILFPNATHQFSVHDLREAGFGVFENHPVKELVKNEDFKKWITPGSGFVPEGAEPTEQFHARCSETLLKLFEYMIRMDVTEAACVTHGGVIMSMLSQRALPSATPSSGWQTPAAATPSRPTFSSGCATVWWRPSTSSPSAMPTPCGVRRKPRRMKHSNKKERSAALRFLPPGGIFVLFWYKIGKENAKPAAERFQTLDRGQRNRYSIK